MPIPFLSWVPRAVRWLWRLRQPLRLSKRGAACLLRGELDAAEQHLKRALALHEQIGFTFGQAAVLENLGSVYFMRGELDKAEEHYNKALPMFEETHDRKRHAYTLGYLGALCYNRGDLDKAEEHHNKALDMCQKGGFKLAQAMQLALLGQVYAHRGELDRAEEHYNRALAICQRSPDRSGDAKACEAWTVDRLGLLAARRAQPEAARELLERARTLYEQMGAHGTAPAAVAAELRWLAAFTPRPDSHDSDAKP